LATCGTSQPFACHRRLPVPARSTTRARGMAVASDSLEGSAGHNPRSGSPGGRFLRGRMRILGEMYRRGGVSAGVSPVTRTRASAASPAGATASDPPAPVPGVALGAPVSRPAPSIRSSASATSRATTAASWSSAPSSRSCRERLRRHLPSAEFADGPALPEAVGGPSPPPCLGGDGR
jgi:hypothetical protein